MRTFHTFFLLRVTIAALFLTALVPMQVAAQDTESSHTFDAHNVTVTWADAWQYIPPADDVSSIISLNRDMSITIVVSVIDSSTLPPEDAVWLVYEDDSEIIEDLSDSIPPRATYTDAETGMMFTAEAYLANDGETTVIVIVSTVPVLMQSAIDLIQAEVQVNGSPVLAGEPLGEAGSPVDLTGQATAETESRSTRGADTTPETTEEATTEAERTSRTSRTTSETPEATEQATTEAERTSRTSRTTSETPEATNESERGSRGSGTTDETPEATEESTTEITRTSRTGSGTTVETPEVTEVATESPDPTQAPTEVATVEPTEPAIESQMLETYIGPVYGYSLEYNPTIWSLTDELNTPTVDGIHLTGETSSLFIWGLNEYGADPVGCLEGEDEYNSAGTEAVTNWQVANDAEGAPLWFEGEDLAWGVFTYTFTSSSGEEVEFVDYISCETIPGQDAVLVVQLTSFPEDYNTNLDYVLDILDTLQFQP